MYPSNWCFYVVICYIKMTYIMLNSQTSY